MMNVFLLVMGVLLLILGWKLFWFFVGVVGFAVGLQVVQLYFGLQPFWVLWVAGLVCGIIGAVLALLFQKLAIGIGGGLAGSLIALHLMLMMNRHPGTLVVLIGGVAGALALYLLFDWALIILSSVAGATFIIEALGRHGPYVPLLFAILIAGGVAFQAWLLIGSRKGGH